MKILVRLPNWLGDSIMATPILGILKNKYPSAHITLVGPAYIKELFENYEYIIDNTKQSKFRIVSMYMLAKKIGAFDLAITLQNTLLSALFLYWTASLKRVGFNKNIRKLFLTEVKEYKNNIHQAARYANLVDCDNLSQELELNIQKTVFDRPTIAIAPGAAYGMAKMWTYFAECIEIILQKQNFNVLIFGTHTDKSVCDEVSAKLNAKNIKHINLAGKTTLKQLAADIGGLKLFITNDSGPMHIAAALGTPCIAIFGSTEPKFTGPWMAKNCAAVNVPIECSPCFKRTCKYGTYKCLTSIDAQSVADMAFNIMKETK